MKGKTKINKLIKKKKKEKVKKKAGNRRKFLKD